MFARSATLKALPRGGRSFATQAVRFAPRVAAAAVAPTSSPLSRRKVSSSSTAAADNKEAPFAAVREDIQIP